MVKIRKTFCYTLYTNPPLSGCLTTWKSLKNLKYQTKDQKNVSQGKILQDPEPGLDDTIGHPHF